MIGWGSLEHIVKDPENEEGTGIRLVSARQIKSYNPPPDFLVDLSPDG